MENIVDGIRKVVQDLLVPELKTIQVELRHNSEQILGLHQEMKDLHREMNERFEGLHKEMNERFEKLHRETNERFEGLHREMIDLKISQKEILNKLDVDKRITKLETLVEQVLKKVAA